MQGRRADAIVSDKPAQACPSTRKLLVVCLIWKLNLCCKSRCQRPPERVPIRPYNWKPVGGTPLVPCGAFWSGLGLSLQADLWCHSPGNHSGCWIRADPYPSNCKSCCSSVIVAGQVRGWKISFWFAIRVLPCFVAFCPSMQSLDEPGPHNKPWTMQTTAFWWL